MALGLLKAINNAPYSKYYKGDVVEIREGNAEICKEEKLPIFLWIEIVGTADKLRYLMESLYDGIPIPNGDERGTVVRKRKYRLPIDSHYTAQQLIDKQNAQDLVIDTFNKTDIDEMVP